MPYDYRYKTANLKSGENGLKLQARARGDVYILTKFNNHQYKETSRMNTESLSRQPLLEVTNWVHKKVRHNGK
jgi:hypothetical protein